MTEAVFVARERELAQLQTFLDRALAGQGQVCMVTGEAGAGKTTLMLEFARRAQAAQADLLVAMGDCNATTGIGDPYLPFREVLGQLTGDVEAKLAQGAITAENASRLKHFLRAAGPALVEYGPDLIDIFVPGGALVTRVAGRLAQRTGWLDRLEELTGRKPGPPGDTGLDQSHMFEQYAQVLKAMAAQQPLMLGVDDLQWADTASINLLFHLSRRIRDSRILLVGGYRPNDVALGRAGARHPLEPVLNELKRYAGDVWIDLEQAKDTEGRRFVDALLDTEPNRLGEAFRQALYRHTRGHPLFTLELLRDLQERGVLIQDDAGSWVEGPALDWGLLPARIEGVIAERMGRLAQEVREILTVAAVEGEDFTAQILARVQELQERRVLRTLSQDLQKRHQLVREHGEVKVGSQILSRYQFAHALFQRYLYHELSAGERRLLHREIAEILEELYAGRTDEITVQLARHYAEAGQGEKAVDYLLRAGDRARAVYAYPEAIAHYQRALAFLREHRDYERAARTLMKLGLTYHIAFDFRQARQAYAEGFALWQRVGERRPAVPPAPQALQTDWIDATTLDPTLAGDVASTAVIEQLFSGLVEWTPDMDIVPHVARSWTVSEGGQKYVFHLREDVQWSDGTPVTAEDFEYAWKRVLDPVTGSPTASLLYDVRGAQAFHQGEAPDPAHVGVRALDAVTLAVELEGPTGYFLHLTTHPVTYPVPRHVVAAHGAAWTAVDNLVTNGPFRLAVWQPGQSIGLSRNPAYPGPFAGNVQQVNLRLSAEPSALWEMYETHRLDLLNLGGLPPTERDRARQRCAGEYVSVPGLATWYAGFDVRRPPFDDARVRQACVLATDRETLADVIKSGWVFPATGGFVPPGMPGHSAGIGLPYDPEQARHLLAQAGYPGGRGFPEIAALTSPASVPDSEYLQAQWRDNLGLEVTWKTLDWKRFHEQIRGERPHLYLYGWVADYPDPDNFLRVSSHRGWTGWRNEAYDRRVEEARRLTNQGERLRRYQEADRILVQAAAIMPLTYLVMHLLVKPWVRKLPMSGIKYWFWKAVILESHG
jgi:ABC-type oligopeptide transport system substrate-binding subunit